MTERELQAIENRSQMRTWQTRRDIVALCTAVRELQAFAVKAALRIKELEARP